MRHAIRQLRHDPGLTLLVALTVALGVGVNTGLFSLVNALHRPLPVRDAGRLVVLATRHNAEGPGVEGMEYRFTYPALADFRNQSRSFSDLIAFDFGIGGIGAGNKPQQFFFSYVTGNYFSALGIKPAAGRLFVPGEGEAPDAGAGVVLGYSCWQKMFGGDPGAIGRQVRINGAPATIVGVAEKRFHGTYANMELDGFVPLSLLTRSQNLDLRNFFHNRTTPRLTLMGMLKPGVTRRQAQSEAEVIARRLERQYPATDKGISVSILPEPWARPAPVRSLVAAAPFVAALFLLLGAFVLVLACMNIGNILLVRAAAREREMAVRAALGSGRPRLIRQVLAESLLLALIGGAAGVILGAWASDAAGAVRIMGNWPAVLDLSFDWRVFSYALAATLLAGIGAGLWPALAASRADIAAVLHECGRSASATRGGRRLRSALVVAQVAGSLTLLIVAGIFVRSLEKARSMDLGFDPRHLARFTMDTAQAGYGRERTTAFYRELERRVRELPGIDSASMSSTVPMSFAMDAENIEVEGQSAALRRPMVLFNSVTPDYFRTMRIDLRRGRGFRDSDKEGAPRVAIVNEVMARRLWPNQDPQGKRFRIGRTGEAWWEVVGVARDGKYMVLFEPPTPFFYVPAAQQYYSRRALQVRSPLPADALIQRVEREIRALDPEMPVSEAGMMEEALEGGSGFWGFRLGAYLSGATGLVGLALAVVGIYGVVSYAAGQRTREIGIRMALGAGKREVFRLVLGQGMALVASGVLAGIAGAWVLAHLMNRWVYSAIQADPAAFVFTSAFLAALALWACYVPARRAMRLGPMDALRHE
ncbi:MAG TPA: ABC transporter permease [Bryobacteraceae bacterium]